MGGSLKGFFTLERGRGLNYRVKFLGGVRVGFFLGGVRVSVWGV